MEELIPQWSEGFIAAYKVCNNKLRITISKGEYYLLHREISKKQTIEIPIDVDEYNIYIYCLNGEIRYSLIELPKVANSVILPLYIFSVINNEVIEYKDYRGGSFNPVKEFHGLEQSKDDIILEKLKYIEELDNKILKNSKLIVELLQDKHKIKHKPITNE